MLMVVLLIREKGINFWKGKYCYPDQTRKLGVLPL
jgi:hypothetical protein